MGQAKMRGTREQRIAQAKTAPPTVGLYGSTKKVAGMRFLVEEVTVLADEPNEEDNGFFLVSMVDQASADDPEAIRDELDPDQWRSLVAEYGIVRLGTSGKI